MDILLSFFLLAIFASQLSGAFLLDFAQRGVALLLLHESASNPSASVDSVVKTINKLYPSDGLDQRIALSRADGYWPYIKEGREPPKKFVYGEFDISLLKQSLERACGLLHQDDKTIVFCDLGSGTGRLVFATAALYPEFKLCRGIELLTSIHEESLEIANSLREEGDDRDHEKGTLKLSLPSDGDDERLPMAPILMECASFDSPYSSFCDANILFCFSSCLNSESRVSLAHSIGRQSIPGTVVITTEYQLPSGGNVPAVPDDPDYPCGEYEIELVDKFVGPCLAVGGESTVYVHIVRKSVGNGKRRLEPKLPVSEVAFRAIQFMEEKNDPKKFVVQVSNQMAFLGFPDSWRPQM